jgi:hypothetical protein
MVNLKRQAPWAVILPSFRLADSSLDWAAILAGQGIAVSQGTRPAAAASGERSLR